MKLTRDLMWAPKIKKSRRKSLFLLSRDVYCSFSKKNEMKLFKNITKFQDSSICLTFNAGYINKREKNENLQEKKLFRHHMVLRGIKFLLANDMPDFPHSLVFIIIHCNEQVIISIFYDICEVAVTWEFVLSSSERDEKARIRKVLDLN